MNKQALYGKEARVKILKGVKDIAAAVKVTLGSSGRNVIIAQSMVVDYGVHNLPLHVSKDGYTVTRAFDTQDPFEKVGVLMIKEAAQKTVDQAGDGTTTTVVLAEAIFEKGMELIEQGANPIELKKGIDKAVEYVVEQLKQMAIPVGGDNEKIFNVATVSANNDAEIGRLIADAFAKIGDYGVIDIEESKGVNTEIKIADGLKFERGWVSPLFINNKEKQTCEFENPLILMYQNRITHHTQYQRAIEIAMKEGRPIIFICEDADEEGLAVLIMNNQRGSIRTCIVRSPSFGDGRREMMEDIAIATGGNYISDIKGVNIKEIQFEDFGQAKKIIISKDETIIIGGSSNKEQFDELIANLKMNLAQEEDENQKDVIEKRIARLTGGVAVIQVGGATETEMKEKMDRVDDAVRATKAAISEGYVAGGGSIFSYISYKIIDAELPESSIDIISKSLIMPLTQMLYNSGSNDTEAHNIKVEVLKNQLNDNVHYGYNSKSGKIEDLLKSGILDPVKVLRCALQNAASAAGMILTAECMIVDTL